MCSYFKQGRCNFSAKSCWNAHETAVSLSARKSRNNKNGDFKCYSCHMEFNTKHGMMQHKKLKQIEEVRECSNYKSGDCGFSDKYCWNKHTSSNHIEDHDEEIPKNQDFHKTIEEPIPPSNGNQNQKSVENLEYRN